MRSLNATIRHKGRNPIDDRPGYLKDGDYVLAVDTETTGLNWYGEDWPFIATASDYDRDYLYKLPADNEHLRRDILNADVLVFHNASFDIHMLVSSGVVSLEEILAKRIEDTDLLARCVIGGQNGPFGLKHLASVYVDSSAPDAETALKERMVEMNLIKKVDQRDVGGGSYYAVWQSYPAVLEEYALKDTRYTYDLYHVLRGMADEDALALYQLEIELMPVLVRMEHRGTRVDGEKVQALRKKFLDQRDRTAELLREANDWEEINLDSNAQVAQLLLSNGVPLTAVTPTGELKVDKWALEPFEESHPIVATLSEYRQAVKFLSTYIEPMLGRETVHPSFWQMGARTGRMSCSNPNMQNIPTRSGPEVREIFIPRDGHCFLVADYSSIELRLLAYYMNHDGLWDVINNGDPFLWLGTTIYGTADMNEWPVKRQSLKNGFYAMTYGAGGPKLATTIGGGMTAAEGRALASSMKKALNPNYGHLNREIRKIVENGQPLKTLRRRAQHVPIDKSYVGLNGLIQGSAADIMKQGLINAEAALAPFAGYPLLTVHDEIVAEVPLGTEADAVKALEQAMIDASPKVPMKVEGKICYSSYGEGK